MVEIVATIEFNDGVQIVAGFHDWAEVGRFRDSHPDIVGIIATWKGPKDEEQR